MGTPKCWFAIAVLTCSQWLAAGEPAPCYVKKDTWQGTMQASREALVRQEAEPAAAKPAAPAEDQLGPWYHIGTFQTPGKSSFSEVFPPETEIDLNKTYGKLRWTAHPEWIDGVLHDLQTDGNTATYLYRTITVKAPKAITGYFGSDDGMALWLNGKKLISNDVPRGAAPNQDQAKLELVAGENKLLFKIHNQGGGCGFYFSTSPTPANGPTPRSQAREKLWELVQRDFGDGLSRRQMAWERGDNIWAADWPAGDSAALAGRYAQATRGTFAAQARELAAKAQDAAGLSAVREVYCRARAFEETVAQLKNTNFAGVRAAIDDLSQTYGDKYPKAAEYLKRLEDLEKDIAAVTAQGAQAAEPDRVQAVAEQYLALRQDALVSGNPLVDFDKLLVIQRNPRQMGLPQNWQGNSSIPRRGYDNQIAILSPVNAQGKLTTLFKPEKGEFVGDVDLHFDAGKMLFSMPGKNERYQIWEINADGTGLRQVTVGAEPDVDNYDPCYLPSGKIIYDSTACFHGVPCVGGGDLVGNLFTSDADGKNARQLCFDQDNNWCPTVLNDGRVLYTRWEYSDTPHYFTRILFRMNPDGTGQMEYYGSNSYWPNSTFYARPIPNHPTEVVAIISGHHGVPRMGELIIFDPAKGRREADGAVRRIPGKGKTVQPIIADGLVEGSWPKFLHPYPLSEKYFLVSVQPAPQAMWGIYLVDVFDNLTLICEQPGYAMLEPVPFRKTRTPPVIPPQVNLNSKVATLYLSDIYSGPGLAGIPRGTVKNLRLYEVHFTYPGAGGHINIGVDGPWDVHRILGTVPVHEDGSAAFKVPANTPVAVQPLDAEGKALQVMRSWYTGMPGEVLTCIGCHDTQNRAPSAKPILAAAHKAVDITPWYGPARGFSFKREVQPVLDKYCVGCHDGAPREDGKTIPDFAAKPKNGWGNFTQPYLALHRYVRRPGPESDYHLQVPMEWHADTSELVQMLRKGHHNVKLDAEAWDRIVTWIDLNVPDHGTWGEHTLGNRKQYEHRLAARTKYANVADSPEALPDVKSEPVQFVKPEPLPERKAEKLEAAGWPFDAAEAKKRQAGAGAAEKLKIELAQNVSMDLVVIPSGSFVMGDANGAVDEYPLAAVKINQPFYMGACEITNEQYAAFDPAHDSAYISEFKKDQGNRGQPANQSKQPVIRVSWEEAMAFCDWLSKKAGRKFTLPTEAQWEYACRAGTAAALNYGDVGTDFGKFANLADQRVLSICRGAPQWIPCIENVNDGAAVTNNGMQYPPNAWGLFGMHGNAAEWTLTTYKPYPYDTADGRDKGTAEGSKVVRGGSFYDRPARARSAFRLAYRPYQKVFSVGFRVVCPAAPDARTSVEPRGVAEPQVSAAKATPPTQ